MSIRRQEIKTVSLEIKGLSNRQFEGHGSIFNNVDYGKDIVLPGAFKGSLKEHKSRGELPQMFWMHRMDQVPGKWLEMEEDSKGLYVRGELADTALGNDMHKLVNMKAVRGLSIGYQVKDREWVDDDEHGAIRLLKELDLWEVSLVSLAMNPLAQVEASKSRLSKDFEYVPPTSEFKRELEEYLRDVGCSKTVAKTLVAKMFDGEEEPGEMLLVNPFRRDAENTDNLSEEEKQMAELTKSLKRAQDSSLSLQLPKIF